jgi:bacterioferritin-associated ferredoxin
MTMGSETDIRRFVEDGFQWGPDVDASDIAVSVKGGAVTLAGFAASVDDKFEVEAAAKRAGGVGLANDIGQVYFCLGCSAQCGRCATTIRRIMDEALGACPARLQLLCPQCW